MKVTFYLANLNLWTLGLMLFIYSSGYEKFFEEQSVFSVLLYMHLNVYEHKNIVPTLV